MDHDQGGDDDTHRGFSKGFVGVVGAGGRGKGSKGFEGAKGGVAILGFTADEIAAEMRDWD